MKILNKRIKADFTVGNIYIFSNVSEGRVFLFNGLTYNGETLQFEIKNSVQYVTIITREHLNKKKENVKSL